MNDVNKKTAPEMINSAAEDARLHPWSSHKIPLNKQLFGLILTLSQTQPRQSNIPVDRSWVTTLSLIAINMNIQRQGIATVSYPPLFWPAIIYSIFTYYTLHSDL